MTPLLIGIDAGASHTEAVLGEDVNRVMDRWRGGPGALRAGAEPDAVRVWAGAIAQVLERFRGRGEGLVVVVGAAGAGNDAVRRRAEEVLDATLGSRAKTRVVTDGEIALEAAFPGRVPGVVVMAGSGSIAYARTAQGTVRRVGGLGWVMGDEGSGYALARAALRWAGRAAEGRAPATALTGALPPGVGVASIDELVRWSLDASPNAIAALAAVVCTAADDGDAAASELVEDAAVELTQLVTALLPASPAEAGGVALGGGLLRAGTAVRGRLVRLLSERQPGLSVMTEPVDPALGALRLAGGM